MIENILKKLHKVKKTKGNEWIGCCPVHDDKTPSMGIKLTDDGKILLHCFGCGSGGIEIIQAIGLNPEDLFPPRENRESRSKRIYYNPETVLKSLLYESSILSLAASDIVNGISSNEDAQRIELAHKKILDATNYCKI